MQTTTGPITIDGLVTVMGQYPTDVHWNGFLVPSIDAWSVDAVLAALEGEPSDIAMSHEWDDDVLVLTEVYGDGEDDVQVDRMEPDADGLYPLGAFAWVWTAAEEVDA
jgi:hypothetical protein